MNVVFFGFFLSITPTTFSKLKLVVFAFKVLAVLINAGFSFAMAIVNQPFIVNSNAADLLKGLQLRVADKKDALEHTSRSLVDFLKRYYRKKDSQ